jgi:hypothetical protein
MGEGSYEIGKNYLRVCLMQRSNVGLDLFLLGASNAAIYEAQLDELLHHANPH